MGPQGGGRAWQKTRREERTSRKTRRLPKAGPMCRQYEGGNYREFFILTFGQNFWTRRPRGRANDRKEHFFRSFWPVGHVCDDRKQRQNAAFFNPKQRRKQDNGPTTNLETRDCLKTRVGAREAREEKNCIFLTSRSYSSAPEARFSLVSAIDLAGPARQADV